MRSRIGPVGTGVGVAISRETNVVGSFGVGVGARGSGGFEQAARAMSGRMRTFVFMVEERCTKTGERSTLTGERPATTAERSVLIETV